MTRTIVSILAAGLLLVLSAALRAADVDQPIVAAPRDGAWARYHLVYQKEGEAEQTGTYWLKSVGRKQVADQPCRWLETEFQPAEGPRETHKILLTEAALTKEERPLDSCLQFYSATGDQPPVSLRLPQRPTLVADVLSLPGFLQKARLVEDPRTIETQSGRLELHQAHAGLYTYSRKPMTADTIQTWETEYRVWMHPSLPIGFAAARTTVRFKLDGQVQRTWTQDFTLQTTGLDARATIPADE